MKLRRFLAALTAFAAFTSIANAQEGPAESELQPDAIKLLEAASKFYQETPIQFNARTLINQSMGKQKHEMDVTHTVVAADGSIFLKGGSESRGMPAPTLHYDGSKATVLLGEDGVIKKDGLDSFQKVFESKELGYDPESGENSIVAGAPGTGMFQRIMYSITKDRWAYFSELKLDGETEVDGKKAHKLVGAVRINPLGLPFEGKVPFEMAIQKGDVPALLSYKPDLSPVIAEAAKTRPQLLILKFDIDCAFTDWKTGDAVDKALLKAPDAGDLKEYASFDAFLEAMQGGNAPDPKTLIGEAAPAIELDLLDGKKWNLGNEKGNNVVILDFWATWCGPCVRAMPILDAVAKEYAKKGVKLVAVNLRETEDQVQAFLKQHKLSPTVVMDRSGAAANRYKVSGIPQTVIVGKDGKVAQVHVGLVPDLASMLKADLDKLVE